jgi:hypothetical protein
VRLAGWLLLIACVGATAIYYVYMSETKTGAGLRLAYMKFYLREALDWHWLATGRAYPGFIESPALVRGQAPLTHSHNDLVQVFFSWGLPGLLAYLAFWAGLLRLIYTRFAVRGEYWPALALVAVVPNMITDLGFHFFEKASFLVILAAMCMACVGLAGRDRARAAGAVDRDVGEGGFRHLDELPLGAEALGVHLDVHGDRSASHPQDLGVEGQDIAHPHRVLEDELLHRDGRHSTSGMARGQDRPGQVDLGHHPAAEDVAVGVAVGGHGNHLQHQLLVRGQRGG